MNEYVASLSSSKKGNVGITKNDRAIIFTATATKVYDVLPNRIKPEIENILRKIKTAFDGIAP